MMLDMELSIERLGRAEGARRHAGRRRLRHRYSSLNYIQQFPVDILKVDKSFIDVVNSDARKSALTATILKLAQDLDLKPVAEGIERADQLERCWSCTATSARLLLREAARPRGPAGPAGRAPVRCRPRPTPSPTAPSSCSRPARPVAAGRYHPRIVRPLSRRPRHVSIVVALTLALVVRRRRPLAGPGARATGRHAPVDRADRPSWWPATGCR
jgi:hypothetical protein